VQYNNIILCSDWGVCEMTVSRDKERVTINIDKVLMEKVRQEAIKENRSNANLIETAIIEYLGRDNQ